MRKFIILLFVLVGSISSANLLQWGTNVEIKDKNGTTITTDFTGDGTLGAFAQLVYAGTNGTVDAYSNSGNGISGDDVVVQTSFSYGGVVPSFSQGGLDGTFKTIDSAVDSAEENGNYYVRVFNGVNINYNDGNSAAVAGVETITHYWDSSVTSFTWDDLAANKQFNFASSGSPEPTDWVAVPEPATMGLLAIGGGISLLANRRKRNV